MNEPSHIREQRERALANARHQADEDARRKRDADERHARKQQDYERETRERATQRETFAKGGSSNRAGQCFPASALVATPYGPRTIANLSEGDVVQAWIPDGSIVARRIVRHLAYGNTRIWTIRLGASTIVHTTARHSFLTANGWRRARDVRAGDTLITVRGARTVTTSGQSKACEPVYSLRVDGRGTYVVHDCVVHSFTYFRTLRLVWQHASQLSKAIVRQFIRPRGRTGRVQVQQ